MNQYTVTAPEAGASGESLGVVFTDGVGHVNDSSKEGRAAIEYFRRRGYTLTPDGGEEEVEAPEESTPLDPDAPGPELPPFDPSEHNADEVIAYLDALDREDTDGQAEHARVIAAERDGKNRKTITDKEAAA
ncbi:hypothetical protein PV728_47430 [Streptomyces europaeiscabiei]|uniref:hypothetical protein n=1 Tax=Streptomyces europaeiscabiei TaxID=146819 RepID=UPI0029A78142|nr:hypothetical protein [Streptomyces europaeiscabiei]MDX3637682.1 hypothetical protein [Streptomyces europaeiscabiei]MDX3655513.1 hypothetical protein [Streptomyces europaeiscabiei]